MNLQSIFKLISTLSNVLVALAMAAVVIWLAGDFQPVSAALNWLRSALAGGNLLAVIPWRGAGSVLLLVFVVFLIASDWENICRHIETSRAVNVKIMN